MGADKSTKNTPKVWDFDEKKVANMLNILSLWINESTEPKPEIPTRAGEISNTICGL